MVPPRSCDWCRTLNQWIELHVTIQEVSAWLLSEATLAKLEPLALMGSRAAVNWHQEINVERWKRLMLLLDMLKTSAAALDASGQLAVDSRIKRSRIVA